MDKYFQFYLGYHIILYKVRCNNNCSLNNGQIQIHLYLDFKHVDITESIDQNYTQIKTTIYLDAIGDEFHILY
jgi:hypothetical protein